MTGRRTSTFITLLALVTFIVDRGLKYLAVSGVTFGPTAGGIHFGLLPNPAIAFSIVFPPRLSFVLIPIVLAVFILVALRELRRGAWVRSSATALVVMPAVSNYIDRLRFGYVVDYISLGDWFPVFNVSDVVIVCGLGLLGVMGKSKPKSQDVNVEVGEREAGA